MKYQMGSFVDPKKGWTIILDKQKTGAGISRLREDYSHFKAGGHTKGKLLAVGRDGGGELMNIGKKRGKRTSNPP